MSRRPRLLLAVLMSPWLFAQAPMARAEENDPAQVVAFDFGGIRFWATNWGAKTAEAISPVFSMDTARGQAVFTASVPSRSKSFLYYYALPVSVRRYPILVLRYRASGLLATGRSIMWIDDGSGPNKGGTLVLRGSEAVLDGSEQEVRRDLRSIKWNLEGSPRESIIGMCFYVRLPEEAPGPGTLEVLSLRFEADPEAPPAAPYAEDAPLTVQVVDHQGLAIADATVTADLERLNFARRARTDAQGRATVTPLDNDAGEHTLTAEAIGYGRVTLREPPQQEVVTIVLPRAATLGGVVRDGAGKPVVGATVEGDASSATRDRSIDLMTSFAVLTDKDGRWRSSPMPIELGPITLRVHHVDHPSLNDVRHPEAGTLEDLLDDQAVFVMSAREGQAEQ